MIDLQAIKAKARIEHCNGYRLLIDGEQIVFKRWSPKLERTLTSCVGKYEMYKNVLGELTINFDCYPR